MQAKSKCYVCKYIDEPVLWETKAQVQGLYLSPAILAFFDSAEINTLNKWQNELFQNQLMADVNTFFEKGCRKSVKESRTDLNFSFYL